MTCPVCSKDSDPKYRPFCCRRCADIDLGRWLTGSYAIPAEEVDPDDPALQAPGDSPTQPKRPQ